MKIRKSNATNWRKCYHARTDPRDTANDLGNLRITLKKNNGEVAGYATHQLIDDAEFARLIFAVEGLIAGDKPPEINAWQDYPEAPEEQPIVTNYPPITLIINDAIQAALPSGLMELYENNFQSSNLLSATDEQLNWLFEAVIFHEEDDNWTTYNRNAFLLLAESYGFSIADVFLDQENSNVTEYPSGLPRYVGIQNCNIELNLPADIRNKALVASEVGPKDRP